LKTLNLKKNSQVTVTTQTMKDESLFELHFIYTYFRNYRNYRSNVLHDASFSYWAICHYVQFV